MASGKPPRDRSSASSSRPRNSVVAFLPYCGLPNNAMPQVDRWRMLGASVYRFVSVRLFPSGKVNKFHQVVG